MAMATTSAAASQVGRKAGTLVVVVMKAKNLPNRQKIGKQDPYCIVRLSHTAERTKTDKRGGQSPFWDHETRFPIPLNGGPDYQAIKVTVFSDDSKEPILIGDASIDLKPVFKDGEFDEWVELKFKNRYAGEVYLEMTYYSEAPPPVPALPREVQSRGLESRGGSQSGSLQRMKRRPLPQQPDLGGLGPPPSRGFARAPQDQLPPSTSHSYHPSLDFRPRPDLYDDLRSDYDPRHPRNRSVDYAMPYRSEYDRSYEYPQYEPPASPTLGRHRSEASLRTQYYEIRPLHEVENVHHPQFNDIREEARRPRTSLPLPNDHENNPYVSINTIRDDARVRPRTSLPLTEPRVYPHDSLREEARIRPRTSLPLPNEPVPYRDDRPLTSSRYRQRQRRESLDDYYSTPPPPPPEEYPPIPVRHESITRLYEQSEESLPVQPYRREPSLPPTQTYSPKAIPAVSYSPHVTPQRPYSPHTSETLATPPIYSPTPPPHRTPPTRSSASPRTPLNGPSPHPSPHVPLKKPSPIRAIDHLPPSSYAPEHTPPSQRRPLPTPPVVDSSPSVYSQGSSPLVYRVPNVPAKIPLGMTEEEYWAVAEEEVMIAEERGGAEVRYRGLDGDGWREMREALPEVGYRR